MADHGNRSNEIESLNRETLNADELSVEDLEQVAGGAEGCEDFTGSCTGFTGDCTRFGPKEVEEST